MFWLRMIATAIAAVPSAIVSLSSAGSRYRFELDGEPRRAGQSVVIRVRLIRASNRMPAENAVIAQAQFIPARFSMTHRSAKPVPTKVSATVEAGVFEISAAPVEGGPSKLRLAGTLSEGLTVTGDIAVFVPK